MTPGVGEVVAGTAGVLGLAFAAAVLAAALDPGSSARGLTVVTSPLHELTRLLVKRGRTTPAPDALLWWVGSTGLLIVAVLMGLLVPRGDASATVPSSIGVVWFNALDVTVWAVVWLAGWGPNSVYPLVGAYRFLAQALSYELPLMFALVAPALGAASLDPARIVTAQQHVWFVVWMPVAFLAFCLGVVGFAFWGPLAHPVGTDVAGGVGVEDAAVRRLLLGVGRYALLGVGAAMGVALFLGGGSGPLLPAWLWALIKTLALLAALIFLGGRTPVVPVQRLVPVAWLGVLPAVLVQLLVVSVVVLVRP